MKKAYWVGIAVLVLGFIINQAAATYIKFKHGTTLPLLPDLFLDSLPYWNICWSYDLVLILAIAVFIYYAFKVDRKSIPYFMVIFGISQALRGISMVLTPFGNPYPGPFACIFNLESMFYGMFPSGHAAVVFTCYLLARHVGFKKFFLALTAIMTITMLLARGHYSIDILAGFIYSYAIYAFGERNLKNLLK